jgi:hypothetical protein
MISPRYERRETDARLAHWFPGSRTLCFIGREHCFTFLWAGEQIEYNCGLYKLDFSALREGGLEQFQR